MLFVSLFKNIFYSNFLNHARSIPFFFRNMLHMKTNPPTVELRYLEDWYLEYNGYIGVICKSKPPIFWVYLKVLNSLIQFEITKFE